MYVMSRVGEEKSFIGTTSSPHDIAKQLHRMNWEDTQCDLVAWTTDRVWAKRLLNFVIAALKPVHHRDSWYAISGERAKQIVIHIAKNAKIEIFDDQERSRRLSADVTREVSVLKQRMDGSREVRNLPPAAGAEIITLNPRGRRDQ